MTTPESNLPSLEKHQIIFHGQAKDYFRIWITNLLLTIATLGIYSAWAKVRSRKYLYGNFELAGSRFDYHADPKKILLGRVLIGVLFAGYSLGGKIDPMVSVAFATAFALITPWLMVRALMFNLGNTSYRNIRFGFKKDYNGSYKAFFQSLVWTIFTFGAGFPKGAHIQANFRMNRIRFGAKYFQFEAKTKEFYNPYFMAFGIYVFGVIVMIVSMVALKGTPLGSLKILLPVIALYVCLVWAGATLKAELINLKTSHTNLGEIKFYSDLKPRPLTILYIQNILVCALTLGLAIPWAIIRSIKYRAKCTQLAMPSGELEKITTLSEQDAQNATADAAADFWDLDLGF